MSTHSRRPKAPTTAQLETLAQRYEIDDKFIRLSEDLIGGRKGFQPKGTIVSSTSYLHCESRRSVNVGKKSIYLSALAWFLHCGEWPEKRVYYADGDITNHRRNNLYQDE